MIIDGCQVIYVHSTRFTYNFVKFFLVLFTCKGKIETVTVSFNSVFFKWEKMEHWRGS